MVQTTGRVDTHADVHVAAVVDQVGAELGWPSFPTTPAGYQDLAEWLEGSEGLKELSQVGLVGVEGTGAYGAGPTRTLVAGGLKVVEVDRPAAHSDAARASPPVRRLLRRPSRPVGVG